MLNRIKLAPIILACATCSAWGQISASQRPTATSALNVPLLDASNSEFNRSFPPEEASHINGTTSVKELEHPLEGKSLESLQRAQSLLAKGETEKGLALTTDRARCSLRFGMIGTTHLRARDYEAAIRELDAAVAMVPVSPAFTRISP